MSTRKILWWSGGSAAVLGLLVWAFAPRPLPVDTAGVTTGRFEQSIEEDGQSRLKERYTVSAPVTARLMRIALREGDPVRTGDAVAVLLPVMSALVDERSSREAEARHGAATANVRRATALVERTAVGVEEAWLELQRVEKLAREGFMSVARLDDAQLAHSAARRALDAARAERDAAVQEQAQAAAALLPAGGGVKAGRPLTIRAPVDGVVLRVAQPSEATLPAGAALLDIGDPARMEVVADLLTTDAVQAQPGRRAVIERWGGPPVEGRVRRVEPAAFTKVSALGIEEQRVKVLVDFAAVPASWQAMGDGYRVTLRIVTQEQDDAVLVPVGAIFPFADGGTAVYRMDGRRARLQPVEVGGRNGSEAWIRSGLKPGQSVIVYPPQAIAEGGRVVARKP